ncbi:hypothetical protein B0A49_08192 [Cryomyces minteri]|uniref:Grh/CP2 DB domain-containing protein n=1 Tax=Cryomyces minteri TaxID=331657 RepID=A0A4U0XQ32_9PEZI|nr:hypothetical protein B0A49_08192 [Cryomyces minteri]
MQLLAFALPRTTMILGDHEELKDQEPTSRGSSEQWRFTPSVLDVNSFAFAFFANQPPSYYTPTLGETNTTFDNQAGDPRIPGLSMGLGTPFSLPTSEGAFHTAQSAAVQAFNPRGIACLRQPPNIDPLNLHHKHGRHTPHLSSHQPSVLEQVEQPTDGSPMKGMGLEVCLQQQSRTSMFSESYDGIVRLPLLQPSIEKSRYRVTLKAPTAMIRRADEIPTTYLNKGQTYSVSIVDTAPGQPIAGRSKYRTFIRISFEEEQQRQGPKKCWQLWESGRGTNEAHQRGGRLQAVEYVGPKQVERSDDLGHPKIELETASFDGFSVKWTPPTHGVTGCSANVRFNFLSTDFSHSKGVKGFPVRFCAKTELIGSQASPHPQRSNPEISYCKIKLFRDHGAERKLFNDIAHVEKMVEKLKEQIARAETRTKDSDKRKRSGFTSKASADTRSGKVWKRKRTWSISSVGSVSGRATAQEDLYMKLATLQDMFTSTQSVSVLYLRGAEQDDPDVHPVRLAGESRDPTAIENNATDTSMRNGRSVNTTGTPSISSPTPIAHSLSPDSRPKFTFEQLTPCGLTSHVSSNEWRNHCQTAMAELQSSNPQQLASPPDQTTRVQTRSLTATTPTRWMEALDVDCFYRLPPERLAKPVACFYIQAKFVGKQRGDNYYSAVYLMQHTKKELVNRIAVKCNIEPAQILQLVRVNHSGLDVLLDDESVRELPEGQDLIAEFTETKLHTPIRREWNSGLTDVQADGGVGAIENVSSVGYGLKLHY